MYGNKSQRWLLWRFFQIDFAQEQFLAMLGYIHMYFLKCNVYKMWHCRVLHCVTSQWLPSLCNNSLGLRRLHWRPALSVSRSFATKNSLAISPPGLADWSCWAGAAWPRSQIRPRLRPLDITLCRLGSLVTTDHTLQNQREFLSDVWNLCVCDAETVSRASLNLRQNLCHQTDVLIFPGVWPTDTN